MKRETNRAGSVAENHLVMSIQHLPPTLTSARTTTLTERIGIFFSADLDSATNGKKRELYSLRSKTKQNFDVFFQPIVKPELPAYNPLIPPREKISYKRDHRPVFSYPLLPLPGFFYLFPPFLFPLLEKKVQIFGMFFSS